MLISYNWLSDYVDLKGITPEELAEKITKAGIEVEHIHYLNNGIKDVVVGYVESCVKHPEADKLNICQVSLGEETVQIICGAPNVGQGQKVAVAKAGAVLPGNVKIKKTKLRGEVSNGMICSLQELGVESKLVPKEFSEGIVTLPKEAELGTDALPYLNLNDVVLDLDILPNSAHCLNLIGAAYEVGALLNEQVKLPQIEIKESEEKVSDILKVIVEAKEAVPYYGIRMIKDVKIGPSPQWLEHRLMASGIRPINNVVDITNFVMLEYGQPLHAFDFGTLDSDEVVVRFAKENETIVTLDSQERELETQDVLITNGQKAVGIAGVMGGENTEVTNDTTTIMLESAIFDSYYIRRTSSRLQLRTDASMRYEKGLDRNRVTEAADRAAQLMQELAGGVVLKGIVDSGEKTVPPATLNMPLEQINQVLGTQLSAETIESVLARLGFGTVIDGERLSVTIPTRRPDVSIPEDIVEEVGRVYGYDHVPTTLPEGEATMGGLTLYQQMRRKTRRYFEGVGLFQATTYSLTTEEKAKQFFQSDGDTFYPVHLAMPMSEDRSTLRMSIVPQLLEVAQYHINRQMKDIFLYEVGSVFLSREERLTEQPVELEKAAAVFSGFWNEQSWKSEKVPVDFFVVKGVLEGYFALLGLDEVIFKPSENKEVLHPGRSADLYLNHQRIGFIGQVHPVLQRELDLPETYVFEVDLRACFSHGQEPTTYKALPRFPAISRDIAIVVDEKTPAQRVFDCLYNSGGKLLKEVQIFDVYQGEHLEKGKKSLAFSLKYFDPERTLTEKEVLKVHEHVLDELNRELGATLRG